MIIIYRVINKNLVLHDCILIYLLCINRDICLNYKRTFCPKVYDYVVFLKLTYIFKRLAINLKNARKYLTIESKKIRLRSL